MPRREHTTQERAISGTAADPPREPGRAAHDGANEDGWQTDSRETEGISEEMSGGNLTLQVEDGEGDDVEELVNGAGIRLDEPCSNLPLLRAQELKIIGRSVTFLGETTAEGQRVLLHYEGVVTMITKDTVVLLQVRRYTKEDFAKYQEKLHAAKKAQRSEAEGGRHRGRDRHGSETALEGAEMMQFSAASESNSNGEVPHGVNGVDCNILVHRDSRENAEESEPEPPLTRQNRLLGAGTMGPVPYMTFSRRRIHDVVFGQDPPCSLYSIFQNPSRKFFDMQCLRMFVRRYLVHTSQRNNPRNINLRPFIEWRCNCKGIDAGLLLNTAKQELAYLIKTEREMAKAAERSAISRRNLFSNYEPSHRLFRSTGILFLTRIPAQTFSLAILEMFVALMLLGFSVYSFATAPAVVIYGYVKDYTFTVTLAGVVSLLSSGMTALHSLRMRLPLTFSIYTTLRLVAATLAIALNTMTLVMIAGAVSYSHILGYLYRIAQESTELCGYYSFHNCTGFDTECGVDNPSPLCMQSWCPSNRTQTCSQPITSTLLRIFVPFIVIPMVLVALFLIDHLLHYRLFQTSRLMMSRM
ncbi:uncharacterized protein Tco025E_04487 [Trypanosoma conorhini]|uniref:Uncharacterized protein n=1 Tax=Trypanosoma conorhini TaxID=83891 RepID=A0A3R7N9S8_9TRYP|nr:uncharacterized protein Tco025E_04487 [Trypanosoma conorhini]RNF18745.1 hypothetical protein Tco025E_04487 [Trypanosoma conorhini]